MEGLIRDAVTQIALLIEAVGAVLVAFATVQAAFLSLLSVTKRLSPEEVRISLGKWLSLSLEFLLAADILRTSIAPSWDEIGKLASIVVIRTVLNFFLERDIREGRRQESEKREASPTT